MLAIGHHGGNNGTRTVGYKGKRYRTKIWFPLTKAHYRIKHWREKRAPRMYINLSSVTPPRNISTKANALQIHIPRITFSISPQPFSCLSSRIKAAKFLALNNFIEVDQIVRNTQDSNAIFIHPIFLGSAFETYSRSGIQLQFISFPCLVSPWKFIALRKTLRPNLRAPLKPLVVFVAWKRSLQTIISSRPPHGVMLMA